MASRSLSRLKEKAFVEQGGFTKRLYPGAKPEQEPWPEEHKEKGSIRQDEQDWAWTRLPPESC